MTYKTKLEEASKEFSDVEGYNDSHRKMFENGSSWTLKYLSEQGEFREFWIRRKANEYDGDFRATVEHEALLASEAKRVEAERLFSELKEVNSKNYKESCEWEFNCKQLTVALKVSEAKLKKCKEQRNYETIRRYVSINKANEEIEKYNVELQS